MEAATIRAGRRRAQALLSAEGPGPLLALLGGALLIALGAALVATHITVFALDESLIQQSAVHYSSDLPHSLLHDLDARATDRLYSLVLSIAYRVSGGPDAIRIDHVLSVLMFVSAAVPIYLFARVIVQARWASVAVALLSIAAPWLTLTTALFTENLSYPLFWWVILAMCEALWRPRARRDLVALALLALLVCTRVQFAGMLIGYIICLLATSIWRVGAREGRVRRLRAGMASALRGFPFTAAATVVILAVFAYARASSQWQQHVEHLFGTYTDVVIRGALPPNMTEGVLIEVIALALGVGLLPAIAAVPWFVRRLARPVIDRRWIFMASCGGLLIVFLILTVYSQGGYLGEITEERYFFYIIPAFWIGAFAALRDGELRASDLLLSALFLAVLLGAIPLLSPLTGETAFLAPVESVVPHVLGQRLQEIGLTGLTTQDALALIALAAGCLSFVVWRRYPRLRAGWVIGVGLLIQLLTTGYAYAVIDGKVTGIQGRTGGSSGPLGWIDAHAGGSIVTWLDNFSTEQPPAINAPEAGLAANQTHVTLFWNSQIRNTALVPLVDPTPLESPVSALPILGEFTVQHGSGIIVPARPASRIVETAGQTESPFLQLAGTPIARSPDGFITLTRVVHPLRAQWMTSGLEPNSEVAPGAPVRLSAYAASPQTAQLSVHLTVAAASPVAPVQAGTTPPSVLAIVRLGGARGALMLRPGAPAQVLTITGCTTPTLPSLSGKIEVQPKTRHGLAPVAVVLYGVAVQEAQGASACGVR